MEDGQDMIFTYCKWVSARWQWSVNLYKNRKETTVYKRRNSRPHPKKKNINEKKLGQIDVFCDEAEEN